MDIIREDIFSLFQGNITVVSVNIMHFIGYSGRKLSPTANQKLNILHPRHYFYMASPILALIMSFFIPGLGQLYTGQFLKAVALFILAVIFGALSTILIGIPFYLIVWFYSMYDAYTSAKNGN